MVSSVASSYAVDRPWYARVKFNYSLSALPGQGGAQAGALSPKTLAYVPVCILRVLTAFENGVDSLRLCNLITR
jgi:hypothetical protein